MCVRSRAVRQEREPGGLLKNRLVQAHAFSHQALVSLAPGLMRRYPG
jgi:hypothetical protein